jgi:Papain family cysteine protease
MGEQESKNEEQEQESSAPAPASTPIEDVLELRPHAEKLRTLQIRTVEQFLARTSVGGYRENLLRYINFPTNIAESFLDELRASYMLAGAPQPEEYGSGALAPDEGYPETPDVLVAGLGGPTSAVAPGNPDDTVLPPLAGHSGIPAPPGSGAVGGVGASGLPTANVDLSGAFTDVRSQGKRNTCVAFAATAAAEYYLNRRGANWLSPQLLYCLCKHIDGKPNAEGTYVRAAATQLDSTPPVICDESGCGYQFSPITGPQCPPNSPSAPFWGASSNALSRPFTVAALKTELDAGHVVVVNVGLFPWWGTNPDFDTGEITTPAQGDVANGGHAVCLVGYADLNDPTMPGFFLFRNSWSDLFGKGQYFAPICPLNGWPKPGYGKLPYGYVTTKNVFEAYRF